MADATVEPTQLQETIQEPTANYSLLAIPMGLLAFGGALIFFRRKNRVETNSN